MRKRLCIVLFISFATLIGGGIWLSSTPSDPVYEGKHFSAWLEELALSPAEKGSPEALNAVRHIGTNALPCMLNMLATKDSKIKKQIIKLARNQSFVSIHWREARFSRAYASMAFDMFGPQAKPAVLGLVHLLKDSDDDVRRRALEALASIGPSASNAIPAVVQLLDNKDEDFVERVRSTLKRIDPDSSAKAYR